MDAFQIKLDAFIIYTKYIPTEKWNALEKVETQIVLFRAQSNGRGENYLRSKSN
jgi:hypothetical protein